MHKEELKLKKVAQEIKDILIKNDVAGSVVLHNVDKKGNGYGEYINNIHTSYSCAYQFEDRKVQFHSKLKDYNSKEEQVIKQAQTANMLIVLAEGIAKNFFLFNDLSKKFDVETGAEHGETKWK